MEKVKKRNENPLIVPKYFRRDIRMRNRYRRGFKINSNGKPKGSSLFNIMGLTMWNGQAIYFPKRKKLKGWQKRA